MGKIFKALEKAEKQNTALPKQPATVGHLQSKLKKASVGPTEGKPIGITENHLSRSESTYPQMETLEILDSKKRAAQPPEPVPADESSPAHVEALDRHTEHELGRLSENRALQRITQPKIEPTVDTGSPEPPLPKPEPRRNSEVTPLMRQKKEADHDSIMPQPPPSEPAGIKEVAVVHTTGTSESKKQVRVRYSKTKVQINDPFKLKNNRVLSVFDDIETTNQFKILRTQVLRKLKAIGGNSILVTSANPYEGKTFTSINLGVSIAKEFDRTVLIIDADIRRPTRAHTDFSTEFFSLKVEKGLTDYLMGDADIEEVLINPGIDKLTLIPGGAPVDNSPELLNSSRMEEMMKDIKSRYPADRLVIVDGPALLHFPDAMILYRYVDGVLPVVEAERTSTEDIKKVMNHLEKVNILGLVMNKNKG